MSKIKETFYMIVYKQVFVPTLSLWAPKYLLFEFDRYVMLHEDWNKNQIKFLKSYLNEVGKILIQKFSDLSCWPFCCHWAWWRETKLLHFLIWRLFDALTIFEHNLYQFMAITLRYVTILNFIYRILKPIFLWNF